MLDQHALDAVVELVRLQIRNSRSDILDDIEREGMAQREIISMSRVPFVAHNVTYYLDENGLLYGEADLIDLPPGVAVEVFSDNDFHRGQVTRIIIYEDPKVVL